LGHEMRGPAGTGRGGVSMAGGREGHGARKEDGVRGHRLPSPPCFAQNLLIYFGFLSRWERLLANIHAVYSYTWILIHFTLISFIYFIVISNILSLYAWRYHWPTHLELPNTSHTYRDTHTHAHKKNKKHQKKKRTEKEDVTTISTPQSLTSVRINDCTLRVPNKTTTLFLSE